MENMTRIPKLKAPYYIYLKTRAGYRGIQGHFHDSWDSYTEFLRLGGQ